MSHMLTSKNRYWRSLFVLTVLGVIVYFVFPRSSTGLAILTPRNTPLSAFPRDFSYSIFPIIPKPLQTRGWPRVTESHFRSVMTDPGVAGIIAMTRQSPRGTVISSPIWRIQGRTIPITSSSPVHLLAPYVYGIQPVIAELDLSPRPDDTLTVRLPANGSVAAKVASAQVVTSVGEVMLRKLPPLGPSFPPQFEVTVRGADPKATYLVSFEAVSSRAPYFGLGVLVRPAEPGVLTLGKPNVRRLRGLVRRVGATPIQARVLLTGTATSGTLEVNQVGGGSLFEAKYYVRYGNRVLRTMSPTNGKFEDVYFPAIGWPFSRFQPDYVLPGIYDPSLYLAQIENQVGKTLSGTRFTRVASAKFEISVPH